MDDNIAIAINGNMCTLMCPCYEGEEGENKEIYDNMSETDLNSFNRTNDESTAEYIKLIWSNDPAYSFESLEECSIFLDSYGSIYDQDVYVDEEIEEDLDEENEDLDEEDEDLDEEDEDLDDEDENLDEDDFEDGDIDDEEIEEDEEEDLEEYDTTYNADEVPITEEHRKLVGYFEQ